MKLKLMELVGVGDKIGLLLLPFLVGGLVLNVLFPRLFTVGGPPAALRVISMIALVPGVIIWLWSVVLILTQARDGKLITGGPYALVKHPLIKRIAFLTGNGPDVLAHEGPSDEELLAQQLLEEEQQRLKAAQ